MKPALVVLAAGMGSRYGGLKQIDPVGPTGELIIDYSVFDALRAGFGRLVFVIRRDIATDFREAIGSRFEDRIDVRYVFQELDCLPAERAVPADRAKPWGTGHAVMVAEAAVEGPFAVINADDFYGQGGYAQVAAFLNREDRMGGPVYALVAFVLRNTLSDHGHVARGVCRVDAQDNLVAVVERTHIERDGDGAVFTAADGTLTRLSGDEPVSMNMWGFDRSLFGHLQTLFGEFLDAHSGDPRAEFFLPGAVDELIRRGAAGCRVLRTDEQWAGVTYRADRPAIKAFVAGQVAAGRYPSPLWGSA